MRNNWTFDNVKESASRYTVRQQWINENRSAYAAALRCGWIDEVAKHFAPSQKSVKSGHWKCPNNLKAEAMRYNSWKEFREKSNVAYKNVLLFGMKAELKIMMDEKVRHHQAA